MVFMPLGKRIFQSSLDGAQRNLGTQLTKGGKGKFETVDFPENPPLPPFFKGGSDGLT